MTSLINLNVAWEAQLFPTLAFPGNTIRKYISDNSRCNLAGYTTRWYELLWTEVHNSRNTYLIELGLKIREYVSGFESRPKSHGPGIVREPQEAERPWFGISGYWMKAVTVALARLWRAVAMRASEIHLSIVYVNSQSHLYACLSPMSSSSEARHSNTILSYPSTSRLDSRVGCGLHLIVLSRLW